MNTKKRFSFRWIPAALVLLAAVLFVSVASAKDWTKEARGMLKLINEFRTGGNAGYWSSDNTTWTTVTGLAPMEYDMELEEIARVRAQEIAVSFSHTRPDGSKWSTAFPAGNYYKAENIACGFNSADAAFVGFMEEDQDYEGQGHRRIMLKSTLTRVGIAAVEVDGVVYWVQEFASGPVKQELNAAGWKKKNGIYYYYKEDGKKATGWLEDGGNWYYLNEKGEMQTGWQTVKGTRYYFDDSGAMQTGWIQSGGKWYYLDSEGAAQAGWLKDGKNWYYLNNNGAMQTGWIESGGKWFYMGHDGVLSTGWIQDGGAWYHTDSSGAMQTGWQQIKGDWYYFRSSGIMVTGTQTIDGQTEYFSPDGVWTGSEIQDYSTPLGVNMWGAFLSWVRDLILRLFPIPIVWSILR